MQRRLPRPFVLLVCLIAIFATLSGAEALAAPKDKAALGAYTEAMDEDYLNTDFDAAIEKLQKAIKSCGKKDCSNGVLGKLYVGLGIVYGGGKQDKKQAKDAFVKAFTADKNAKPVEDYMAGDLTKLFEAAKKEAGSGGGGDDDDDAKGDDDDDAKGDDDDDDGASGGDFEYSAPSEALVTTPLPIFVKVPEDISAASLKLRYKPFGSPKWMSVNMKKMAGGFGGAIPCAELSTTGQLKLYIIINDKEGDPVATAGTRKAPLSVEIKNKIDGDQPSFPGEEPPEQCVGKGDCPPDFPGCAPTGGGGRGEKGWGASCESSKECREGLACVKGSCEQGEPGGGDDDDDGGSGAAAPDDEGAKNFATVGLQLDIMGIAGAEDVCGVSTGGKFEQTLDNYFCFLAEDGGEFLGKPMAGKFNKVEGGAALAGARILLGYDRLLWEGLAVGARLGYAFGGSPGVGDAQDRYDSCVATYGKASCREPLASDFMAFHAELRGSWQFLRKGLLRPYAFLGAGFAQVNAGVTVAVCDTVGDDGNPVLGAGEQSSKCVAGGVQGKKREDIQAYQVTGLNFIGLGGGAIFALHKNWGVNAELKLMMMVPTFGFVIAPNIAPVFMF